MNKTETVKIVCNNIPNRVKRASGVTIYEGRDSTREALSVGRSDTARKAPETERKTNTRETLAFCGKKN